MPRGVYIRKPRAKREREIARCAIDGCDRPATRTGRTQCELHFGRVRRTGSTAPPKPPVYRYTSTDGYVMLSEPTHPLASKNGRVGEHRVVYFSAHGAGPFECHWCGIDIEWKTLHIDHVNDLKNDNRLENLVASCNVCNPMRGRHKSLASNQARGLNIEFGGERLPIKVWADRLGISKESLKYRLNNGWSTERALTEARGKFGPRTAR